MKTFLSILTVAVLGLTSVASAQGTSMQLQTQTAAAPARATTSTSANVTTGTTDPGTSPQAGKTDALLEIKGVDGETTNTSIEPDEIDVQTNAQGAAQAGGTADINIGIGELRGGVSIAVGDVNGLSDSEKATFIAKTQNHSQIQTEADLMAYTKGVLLGDTKLTRATIAQNVVEVETYQDVKLFGGISMKMHTALVIDMSKEESERVKVKFPWWSFLAAKTMKAKELHADMETKLRAMNWDASISGHAFLLTQVASLLTAKHSTSLNAVSNIR